MSKHRWVAVVVAAALLIGGLAGCATTGGGGAQGSSAGSAAGSAGGSDGSGGSDTGTVPEGAYPAGTRLVDVVEPALAEAAKAGDTTGITIRYCEMSEGAYSYIETNDPERVAQALAVVNEATLGQATDVTVLDWDQWVVFERGDEALGSVSFNGGYLNIEGINYEDNQGISGLKEAFNGLERQYEE